MKRDEKSEIAKVTVPIVVDIDSIRTYLEQYDIVEVVRCKDCKHRFSEGCRANLIADDACCSYGERKK